METRKKPTTDRRIIALQAKLDEARNELAEARHALYQAMAEREAWQALARAAGYHIAERTVPGDPLKIPF